jgi:hypothetical protein
MDDFSIKSARAKLKWAAKLLDDLDELRVDYIDTFVDEVSLREVRMFKLDGVQFSRDFIDDIPDIPDEIPRMAGDAMHNVRSALDHVACACVIANGSTVEKQHAFPIYSARPVGDRLRSFNRTVEGMAKGHIEAIKRLQPYENPHTPEARKLIALTLLDNTDKHHTDIPIFPTCVGPAEGEKMITDRPLAKGERVNYGVYTGGDLRKFPEVVEIHPPRNCRAWVPLQFDLAFGRLEIRMAELREIRAYVVGIVESFGPILDKPVP